MDPESQNELFATRRAKLDALRALGVDPFGGRFDASGSIAEIRARFAEGNTERAAGRLTAHRDMGKSHFLDLNDGTGRIQLFVSAKELAPSRLEIFKLLDLADFIGVEGECFVTKTGEPSLRVKNRSPCSRRPSARCRARGTASPMSSSATASGISTCSRTRARATFSSSGSAIVREIRDFLQARGFLEVETPMMQSGRRRRGGAAVQDAPQRAEHRPLPAHRAGALSEAAARRRVHKNFRAEPEFPQRRHFAAA